MSIIPRTRKKLRECAFYFQRLSTSAERVPALDAEEFDFSLSAFLSAGRSVTLVLQVEEKARYDSWFPTWRAALEGSGRELLKFMNEQRVAEVHLQGAAVETRMKWSGIAI